MIYLIFFFFAINVLDNMAIGQYNPYVIQQHIKIPIKPHDISSALERPRNTCNLFFYVHACQLFIRNYFSPPQQYYIIMSKQDSSRDVHFRYVNGVSTRNTVRAISTGNTCLTVYIIVGIPTTFFRAIHFFSFDIYFNGYTLVMQYKTPDHAIVYDASI